MKIYKSIYPLILIFFLSVIKGDPNSCQFHWLLGTWVSENEKSITTETWTWISKQTLEGSSITKGKSSNSVLQSESLRLVKMEGEIFYIAKVAHNELPIAFKMTSLTDSSATFENTKHDFPTKIDYRLITPDKLSVKVSNEKKHFTITYIKELEK